MENRYPTKLTSTDTLIVPECHPSCFIEAIYYSFYYKRHPATVMPQRQHCRRREAPSEINRQDSVIVDELLCFLANKIDVLPPQSIADLCRTTYDEGEIEAAKKRLCDLCADENSSRFRRRQGPKKSAVNLDDMMRLLQEKGTDVPLFVARDLSRLPPITFDSIDVSSLLHGVRRAH